MQIKLGSCVVSILTNSLVMTDMKNSSWSAGRRFEGRGVTDDQRQLRQA